MQNNTSLLSIGLAGFEITQCLYVAAKLNIADHLFSGNKTIDELATLTNTKSEPLYRVMRCLASLGIFKEEQNKIFTLNEAANDLRSDVGKTLKSLFIYSGEELYQAAGQLLYSVQTGLPSFNHIYGMSHWDFLNAHPDKAAIFHNAMEKGLSPEGKEIISYYDFSPYKNIIDVGGGKGQLVCDILQQYPSAHGISYDLVNAEDQAIEFIKKSGLSDRAKFVSGSFFESVPSGDLYLLRSILHDWDDKSAISILKNCRKSISNSGRVLLFERVIVDNPFKSMNCMVDLIMLTMLTGKERNLSEYKNLLNHSGFEFIQMIDTKTVMSIVEAKPI